MHLSICIMVKNEEKYLKECLTSLQPLRDAFDSELIVVDTGSDDSTVEIARQFTDKVYFHEWNNDFSAMRNITLSYAKGKWIYITDGDEVLETYQPLIEFLRSSTCKQYGAIAISGKNIVDLETGAYSSQIGFRLFKNDGYFHYEGAVHNQAVFRGKTLAIPEVTVLHYGYISSDKELMERKFQRTSAILRQELEKDPFNIYYWTQLSVTYAMHEEFSKAIEYAEKAYFMLPAKKEPAHMFVLIQMMLVYHHEKLYEKVIDIACESMSIKEGYLDVYYYYAEALAMTDQYLEGIKYFEKYLDLLAERKEQEERDVTLIEYSLGLSQLVYFNMSRMAKREGLIDKALYYAEKIEDEKFVTDNLLTVMELYLDCNKIDEMYKYYDERLDQKDKIIFTEQLAIKMEQLNSQQVSKVVSLFYNVSSTFGLLCCLVRDCQMETISEESQNKLRALTLENIPVYCSDIFYYLLKMRVPMPSQLLEFKEIWFGSAFDYISKRHDDLSFVIYKYLEKFSMSNDFVECKLHKVIARYALLLNKLDSEIYYELFNRYIKEGIVYLQNLYSAYMFDHQLVYDLKNDEEVFLLYMYYALVYENDNHGEYVKYLRLALSAFPGMSRGIEIKLKELQISEDNSRTEFEQYKLKIKDTINALIHDGKMDEAGKILAEYKTIVPDDLEAILLESKIFLH